MGYGVQRCTLACHFKKHNNPLWTQLSAMSVIVVPTEEGPHSTVPRLLGCVIMVTVRSCFCDTVMPTSGVDCPFFSASQVKSVAVDPKPRQVLTLQLQSLSFCPAFQAVCVWSRPRAASVSEALMPHGEARSFLATLV